MDDISSVERTKVLTDMVAIALDKSAQKINKDHYVKIKIKANYEFVCDGEGCSELCPEISIEVDVT